MRRLPCSLFALLLSSAACVTQPSPSPPAYVESPPSGGRPDEFGIPAIANRESHVRGNNAGPSDDVDNPQAYVRQLFSRFPERIVDVEKRYSGPGAFLVGVTLYERPEAHHIAGLCQVRVHEVGVNTAPPPQDPPRHAQAVRTSTRFFAIGPVNSSIPPADQRQRCAGLPNARNFFSASEDDARLALQTLTDARYFVVNMPRAITFTCKSYRGDCSNPSQLFMRHLTPDRVKSVERIACADGSTDIDSPCFRIGFGYIDREIGGDWTITTHGRRRPITVHLEQSHPPVV